MINKIGIIVDGPGDYAALKTRFKSDFKIVKTDGPRGHTVTLHDIVRRSFKQINILKAFKCNKIITLIDAESRNNYSEFIQNLCEEFSKISSDVTLVACSPNQMIENWYLADIENLSKKKKFLKNNIKQKNYEGTHGKSELKNLFESNIKYNEIKHSSQLFEIIEFETAKKNSPSFKHFLENIV